MKQIEMIKAFAELEGVELFRSGNDPMCCRRDTGGNIMVNGMMHSHYNPITDLALNCAARDKYECEVYYNGNVLSVQSGHKFDGADVKFNSKDDLPRSVIECILKSKGLWV